MIHYHKDICLNWSYENKRNHMKFQTLRNCWEQYRFHFDNVFQEILKLRLKILESVRIRIGQNHYWLESVSVRIDFGKNSYLLESVSDKVPFKYYIISVRRLGHGLRSIGIIGIKSPILLEFKCCHSHFSYLNEAKYLFKYCISGDVILELELI